MKIKIKSNSGDDFSILCDDELNKKDSLRIASIHMDFYPPYIYEPDGMETVASNINDFEDNIDYIEKMNKVLSKEDFLSDDDLKKIEEIKKIVKTLKWKEKDKIEEIIGETDDCNWSNLEWLEIPFDYNKFKETNIDIKEVIGSLDSYIKQYGRGLIIYLYNKTIDEWIKEAKSGNWKDNFFGDNGKELNRIAEIMDQLDYELGNLIKITIKENLPDLFSLLYM